MSQGLTFVTAYTWSKSISGPSDIGGQVGPAFTSALRKICTTCPGGGSVSGFDLTQRFVQTILYDIPFFRGLHGAGKYLLDGWQVSTIITAQSGLPTPVSTNRDTTGIGTAPRPDLAPGQSGYLPSDQLTWQR
jgi:hypothetical protein